jgi:hypothetical protein
MTHTSPSIVSHRLEGFGIPTNQARASDSVMISTNPEPDKHMRGLRRTRRVPIAACRTRNAQNGQILL